MVRRCPAPMITLAAVVALGSFGVSTTVWGDSLTPSSQTVTADYSLTSVSNISAPSPNISGPQVEALIIPPGGVVPPTSSSGAQLSPLTVLPGSTGFDPNQLVVALKNTTGSNGQAEQMFGLVFFGQGFKAGGVLNFSLSIDKSLASNPPMLEVLTPGISIAPVTDAGSGSNSGSGGTTTGGGGGSVSNAIPEPMSIMVWSVAALAALARAGYVRKRRIVTQISPC